MRKSLFVVIIVLLAGCQAWGPTWSEVTGARYPTGEIHQFRRPAIVERIDAQGAFVSDPIKTEPGAHRIELSAPVPGWPGGSDIKVMMIDMTACKRYYLNAQFENLISSDWKPVIGYEETIAGCRLPATK